MSAFPGGFNAAVDRYDPRAAARLFRWLWPDPAVAHACAAQLSASIRTAHVASDACWEVTMFADKVRLNVGQVEVLMLRDDVCLFLHRAPLDLAGNQNFDLRAKEEYAFPSVPVPSGVCFCHPDSLLDLPAPLRESHDAYIRAAASFKRVSPFKKSFSPAVLEYLERVTGDSLPRPSYLPGEAGYRQVLPLPDEVTDGVELREGVRYQVMVNAYERDPRVRQMCIEAHGTDCAVCGFSFGITYGEVAAGYTHVHHLLPLSEAGGEYVVDPVADLRPVCPNCHAVLHRRTPAYSIDEVRGFLRRSVHD